MVRSRRTRRGDHAVVARWYGIESMNFWIPYGSLSDRSLRSSAGANPSTGSYVPLPRMATHGATRPKTSRTMVRRLPARGHYDRATLDAILDEGLVCHIGFLHERQPFVIPTMYARDGDRLLLHASSASRVARTLGGAIAVCVTVTLLDGLVLARSGFHHSANYRSAVVLGKARPITDRDGKLASLEAISEHLVPGRWSEVRAPSAKELRATSILELPIIEAS